MTEPEIESRAEFPTEEFVATEAAAFTSTITNGDNEQAVVVLDLKLAEIGEDARFEDCHVQIAFDRDGFVAVMTEALAALGCFVEKALTPDTAELFDQDGA